jgi:putative peptidoglycan lipid II flippase
MVPVTITLGLINVSAVIGTLFASRLIDPELAPAAIDKAFRLYMLPQGMFAVAVTTVLFPTLSRLSARGDKGAFGRTLDIGLRQVAFLLIPAGIVSAVLAVPIVRLVYQRGEFTAEDTTVVAGALAAFSVGLVFNGWMLLFNRSFYSLQANWVPTAVATGTLTLNVVLDVALYRVGVWGIPLATSLANVVGAVTLIALMRPRVDDVDERRTVAGLLRILVASAVFAALAYACWRILDDVLGRAVVAQLVSLGVAFAIGGSVYLLVCRALRVRELEALLALLRRPPAAK